MSTGSGLARRSRVWVLTAAMLAAFATSGSACLMQIKAYLNGAQEDFWFPMNTEDYRHGGGDDRGHSVDGVDGMPY